MTHMVRKIILISRQSEACCMYHSSRALFSSTDNEVPPLICANPVNPGLT